jgi:ribose transport system substrate-binding protein
VVKKLRFVISLPNDNSYQREQAKAARETADRMGAEVQILDAKNDAVTQSSQVLEFIQSPPGSRPDAVLFEPLTTTGLVRPAEAAVASGIGWVVLNSDVEYLDRLRNSSGLPIFGVTRDHREIGRLQARQFAALLPQGGTVLYVQGPSNNHAAIERTAGMESQKAANIHVQSLRCKWDEGSAYQAVSAWLQLSTNGANINIVGCQYDGIARGAKRAFEDLRDRAGRERFQSVHRCRWSNHGREGMGRARNSCSDGHPSLSTTEVAIRMLVQAFSSGKQPPLRTLIELASYPTLEDLLARAPSKARGVSASGPQG